VLEERGAGWRRGNPVRCLPLAIPDSPIAAVVVVVVSDLILSLLCSAPSPPARKETRLSLHYGFHS